MSTYCWDATLLIHAERADRLDTLGSYLPTGDHVVTDVVATELGPMLLPSWLRLVSLDDLATLRAFTRWRDIVGATGRRNVGEAGTLAWAETHQATAVIDDRSARRAAGHHQADVHGSLWMFAEGVNQGRSTPKVTSNLCDVLIETGIHWPFSRGQFETWARSERLLPAQEILAEPSAPGREVP